MNCVTCSVIKINKLIKNCKLNNIIHFVHIDKHCLLSSKEAITVTINRKFWYNCHNFVFH